MDAAAADDDSVDADDYDAHVGVVVGAVDARTETSVNTG